MVFFTKLLITYTTIAVAELHPYLFDFYLLTLTTLTQSEGADFP
jgi:hypothetical protein